MTESDVIWEHSVPHFGANEQRHAVRYPCRADGPHRLVVARRDESRWARARDISTDGISLYVAGPYEPGTVAFLRLQVKKEAPPLTVMVEVMHTAEQPDGNWLVGCKFDGVGGDLSPTERVQFRDFLRAGTGKPDDTVTSEDVPASLAAKLFYPCAPTF